MKIRTSNAFAFVSVLNIPPFLFEAFSDHWAFALLWAGLGLIALGLALIAAA